MTPTAESRAPAEGGRGTWLACEPDAGQGGQIPWPAGRSSNVVGSVGRLERPSAFVCNTRADLQSCLLQAARRFVAERTVSRPCAGQGRAGQARGSPAGTRRLTAPAQAECGTRLAARPIAPSRRHRDDGLADRPLADLMQLEQRAVNDVDNRARRVRVTVAAVKGLAECVGYAGRVRRGGRKRLSGWIRQLHLRKGVAPWRIAYVTPPARRSGEQAPPVRMRLPSSSPELRDTVRQRQPGSSSRRHGHRRGMLSKAGRSVSGPHPDGMMPGSGTSETIGDPAGTEGPRRSRSAFVPGGVRRPVLRGAPCRPPPRRPARRTQPSSTTPRSGSPWSHRDRGGAARSLT
jgi:hypothetical protein